MRQGRVFLAGDAAHIHSPTGGQGITTGIHDAINLAWKLGRVALGASDTLLDTYEEERLPHVAEVLRETDRTTSVLLAPRFPWRQVRDYVVLPLLRSRRVQARMFGKFSQLHVNYRRSGLAQPVTGRRSGGLRLRPGDRAPDVTFLLGRAATRVTLFDLLRGLRPVLLVRAEPTREASLLAACERIAVDGFSLAPAATGEPRPRALTDLYGDFARLYGMPSELLCIVRPDGHIGFFSPTVDLDALAQYLGLICDPAAVDVALP